MQVCSSLACHACSSDRRRSHLNVMLKATLRIGHNDIPVRIRELCSRGALLGGERLPLKDQEVVLETQNARALGYVHSVWPMGCEIVFYQALNERVFLRPVTNR